MTATAEAGTGPAAGTGPVAGERLRRASALFVLLAVGFAAYRGFRLPSVWAASYAVPDYGDGVLRRALLGSVLGPLGLNDSYAAIAAVALAVTLALAAAACLWAWRRGSVSANLLLGLWFLGPFGGFLFHATGYPEQAIFLLFLAALWTGSLALAIAVAGVALYLHELAVVLLVPTVLLLVAERRGARAAALAGAALAAAFLPLLLAPGAEVERLLGLVDKLEGVFGENARASFVPPFARPLTDHVPADRLETLAWVLLWSAPLLAGVVMLCGRGRRGRAALAAVLLAPFLLGPFGADAERWGMIAAALALLHALRCVRHDPPTGRRVLLLAAALLWVAQFELRYFDGLEPRRLTPQGVAAFAAGAADGSLFAMPER